MKKMILFTVLSIFFACKRNPPQKLISNDISDTIVVKDGQKKMLENKLNVLKNQVVEDQSHNKNLLMAIDFSNKTLDTLKSERIYKKINLICEGEENYPSKCFDEKGSISISYKEIVDTEKDSIKITHNNRTFSFLYDTEGDYGNEFLFFGDEEFKIILVKQYLENYDYFYLYWLDSDMVYFLGDKLGDFSLEEGVEYVLNIFEKENKICLLISTSLHESIILKFDKPY
ncbi:hypothetical protein [Capnocytophaga cynodegmi]|uniref:hypothetical protein n=2 Tax=Capnocytophaga cynodegmi TaxID=28189 RepID=UPI0038587568